MQHHAQKYLEFFLRFWNQHNVIKISALKEVLQASHFYHDSRHLGCSTLCLLSRNMRMVKIMKVPEVPTAGVKPDKVANVNNLASNLSPQEVETEGSGSRSSSAKRRG